MTEEPKATYLRFVVSLVLFGAAAVACSHSMSTSPSPSPSPQTQIEQSGRTLYEINCAVCHGNSGAGDGPAGQDMTPKASKLSDPAAAAKRDSELFDAIKRGVRRDGRQTMPPARGLSDEQISRIVSHVRTMAPRR